MNRVTLGLAIGLMLIAGQMVLAAPCCDMGCCEPAVGCDAGCCGTCPSGKCQLVCETKTVKKHCWNVEEKQICPMRPGCMKLDFGPLCDAIGNALSLGKCGGCKCKKPRCNACGEVECCEPACEAACVPPPRCGCPITVKKLSKHEYKVEKSAYHCEPVDCGPACCEAAADCGCR